MLLITTTTIAAAHPNFIIGEKNLNKKTDTPGPTPADDSWKKTFGGWRRDAGFSVQQTTDGGYIIVGDRNFLLNSNVWLVKYYEG
jgi:hypothetical protein